MVMGIPPISVRENAMQLIEPYNCILNFMVDCSHTSIPDTQSSKQVVTRHHLEASMSPALLSEQRSLQHAGYVV